MRQKDKQVSFTVLVNRHSVRAIVMACRWYRASYRFTGRSYGSESSLEYEVLCNTIDEVFYIGRVYQMFKRD